MSLWPLAIQSLRENGASGVMVTIVSTKGSTPRKTGTSMWVTEQALVGTIGGGNLEYKSIQNARAILNGEKQNKLQRMPLGASLGQCCGGSVVMLFELLESEATWFDPLIHEIQASNHCILLRSTDGQTEQTRYLLIGGGCEVGDWAADQQLVDHAKQLLSSPVKPLQNKVLFEVIRPAELSLVIFGAGHVGRAIVKTFEDLPCQIIWIDSRDDYFPQHLPHKVRTICSDVPAQEIDTSMKGSYFLVMTHSHALDRLIVESILRQGDFAYLGLIGSATKRRQFETSLLHRGLSGQAFSQVTCPIGVAGIQNKAPQAIAISVATEILQRYERGGGDV